MGAIADLNPFSQFFGLDGSPLEDGSIYIGEPNKDPVSFPVTVYYDSALTIPAAQPLTTTAGYVARNGAPAYVFASGNYSIRVLDSRGRQVYYVADTLLIGNQVPLSANDVFIANYAGLRNYTGSATRLYVTGTLGTAKPEGIAGWFERDSTDTTSADNGGTIIVDSSSRRWKRDFVGPVMIDWFGGVGDGIADDTTPVTNALAVGKITMGSKTKIYGVSGNITLPDNADLRDAYLKQLSPNNASRRTLTKTTVTGTVALRRVTVDRGGTGVEGSIADGAGIWIANTNGVILDEVEVFGNSRGIGINLVTCTRVRVLKPYVHDMQWISGSDPGTEQIVGIWLNGCSDAVVEEPIIKNLTGKIGAAAVRAYQTDGLDFSGSSLFQVRGGRIQNTGEGIDISGSVGNTRFTVIGTHVVDIDSWGIKIANSGSGGEIIGCIARDCGYAGFVASGPAEAGLPNEKDLTFIGCKSFNAGSNGNWAAFNTAGFSIVQGAFDLTYPQGVRFVECEAIDNQGSPTMKYGFRCEPTLDFSVVRINRMFNCYSRGHTIAKTLGPIGDVWASMRMNAVTSTANNTQTSIKWNNLTEDPYSMVIVDNTAITKCWTFDGTATFTDETTDINSGTANDVPLYLPVNAAIYFGHTDVFNEIKINVGTAATGGAVTWEYWNGSAWTALTVTDGTTAFQTAGTNSVTWTTIPTTWAQTAVNGVTEYWVRARVTTILTGTPALTQAWFRRDVLIREDGLYQFNAQVDFATNATGTRQIRAVVDGTTVTQTTGISTPSGSTVTIATVSSILRLSRGNLLTFQCLQDSGGALNQAGNFTFLRVAKVAGRE